MKTIKPDELSEALNKYLTTYSEEISDEVISVTDEITKEAKDELIRTSPKGKGSRSSPYYQGWAVKIQKKGKGKYEKVIWNKTNYQLTHLLEFGHATRNGKRTKAIPHIRPVEEKYKAKFVDLLERKMGGIG